MANDKLLTTDIISRLAALETACSVTPPGSRSTPRQTAA